MNSCDGVLAHLDLEAGEEVEVSVGVILYEIGLEIRDGSLEWDVALEARPHGRVVQGWYPLSLNMEREICGAGMLAAAVVVTIFRMAKNTQK